MAQKLKPGKLRGNTCQNATMSNSNDYMLTIIGEMNYSLKDLAELVVKNGTTTLQEEQLVDAFRMMAEKGIEMALQGNHVDFDYFSLWFGVKGAFNWANEPFTRPKHQVCASMSVSADLRKAMEETLVENRGLAQSYAQIETIVNTVSGEVNMTLTAGAELDIRGGNLAVWGDDPNVGIYLQEEDTSCNTRIKVSTILTNEPQHLRFVVPANVEKGKKYVIVSVSQSKGICNQSGTLLKELRTELSPCILSCTDGNKPDEAPDIA